MRHIQSHTVNKLDPLTIPPPTDTAQKINCRINRIILLRVVNKLRRRPNESHSPPNAEYDQLDLIWLCTRNLSSTVQRRRVSAPLECKHVMQYIASRNSHQHITLRPFPPHIYTSASGAHSSVVSTVTYWRCQQPVAEIKRNVSGSRMRRKVTQCFAYVCDITSEALTYATSMTGNYHHLLQVATHCSPTQHKRQWLQSMRPLKQSELENGW